MNIKRILKYFLIAALVQIVVWGCQNTQTQTAADSRQDSLVTMVENRIAAKKEYARFRENVLPYEFQQKVSSYFPVIRKYAKRYGFDWRLIVLQILKESSFRENAISRVGAMGLMQIMPATAIDLRKEMDIEYIAISPRENIAGGIYHLYKQMQYFPDAGRQDRLELALAAYNCGPGHIFDAQDIARLRNLDPNTWAAVKQCLPALEEKDWQLHLETWEMGTPNFGYFYGYNETIDYVDDIIRNYQAAENFF
jgi:membrane-bound lytic murein transglycosylase F